MLRGGEEVTESVGEVRRRQRGEAKAEEKVVAALLRRKAGLSGRDKAEKAEKREISREIRARRTALAERHSEELGRARARRDNK